VMRPRISIATAFSTQSRLSCRCRGLSVLFDPSFGYRGEGFDRHDNEVMVEPEVRTFSSKFGLVVCSRNNRMFLSNRARWLGGSQAEVACSRFNGGGRRFMAIVGTFSRWESSTQTPAIAVLQVLTGEI
jgi:hypothetical protein